MLPRRGVRSPLLVALTTPRLRLEPIRIEHADALYDGLRDPSLYTYETDQPPRGRAALRRRFASLSSGRSPDDDQHWLNWIPIALAGERALGSVQATVDDDLAYAHIGYEIVAAEQRNGFGAEAVGAVANHLLRNGVQLLHAVIDVRNAPSIALVERLGFERTGTRPSDDIIGGIRWFDHDFVLRRREGDRGGRAETSYYE